MYKLSGKTSRIGFWLILCACICVALTACVKGATPDSTPPESPRVSDTGQSKAPGETKPDASESAKTPAAPGESVAPATPVTPGTPVTPAAPGASGKPPAPEKASGEPNPLNAPEGTGQADKQPADWIVAPILQYDSIAWCPKCGYCTGDFMYMIDENTGALTGSEHLGHGGAAFHWIYDTQRSLFGKAGGSEDGAFIEMYPIEELAQRYPEATDRLNMVFAVNFSEENIESDMSSEWLSPEAYTGKSAVMYGNEFISGFIYDNSYEWGDRGPDNTNKIFALSNPITVAAVRQNGKWGLLDINGDVLMPFDYEHILIIDNDTVFAKTNGAYGIYRHNGGSIKRKAS